MPHQIAQYGNNGVPSIEKPQFRLFVERDVIGEQCTHFVEWGSCPGKVVLNHPLAKGFCSNRPSILQFKCRAN